VLWQSDEERARGKLQVESDQLLLEGVLDDGHPVRLRLPYSEVAGLRIGRSPRERLNGGGTLILEQRGAAPLRIAPLGAGLLSELSDLVSQLCAECRERLERVVVVAPLRQGALDGVRALLQQGPPFDPEQAGLERHDVFATERELIFLFEGQGVSESLGRLASRPGMWRAAAAWGGLLAGRPRLAEARYSWRRTGLS
jgi:hypothetical protein